MYVFHLYFASTMTYMFHNDAYQIILLIHSHCSCLNIVAVACWQFPHKSNRFLQFSRVFFFALCSSCLKRFAVRAKRYQVSTRTVHFDPLFLLIFLNICSQLEHFHRRSSEISAWKWKWVPSNRVALIVRGLQIRFILESALPLAAADAKNSPHF